MSLKYQALAVWEKKNNKFSQITKFENPLRKDKGVVFAKVSTFRKIYNKAMNMSCDYETPRTSDFLKHLDLKTLEKYKNL